MREREREREREKEKEGEREGDRECTGKKSKERHQDCKYVR